MTQFFHQTLMKLMRKSVIFLHVLFKGKNIQHQFSEGDCRVWDFFQFAKLLTRKGLSNKRMSRSNDDIIA